MKVKEIKASIKNMFKSANSSNFDNILLKINKGKGVILEMKKKSKEKKTFKNYSLSFASILVVAICIVGFVYFSQNKVVATVNIDVNPAIELQVNKEYKIVKVITHNEEASSILGNMDLVGSSLEVGTNAILGSLVKEGYITNEKNSVLITVLGDNNETNETIRNNVVKNVDTYLSSNSIDSAIMSQSANDNSLIQKMANDYNITEGKAELINKIMLSNSLYSASELAKLSTNDLTLLANSKKNNVSGITIEGKASDSTYIGKEKAKSIALTNAKISKSNNIEIELDYENGVMVYEVEFDYGTIEYDYEINAITGEIIKYTKENADDDKISVEINKSYISKEEAKKIALTKAGVSTYSDYDIEFEYRSGIGVYEISFETSSKEYDYLINATNGEIINSEIDVQDDQTVSSTSYISKSKAKSIALNKANVSTYFDYEIEMDTYRNKKVYEISFETSTKEYEYIIDAINGNILDSKIENSDND